MTTPNLKTNRSLRIANLVLSIVASTLIFGAIAIGLTWEATGQIAVQAGLADAEFRVKPCRT